MNLRRRLIIATTGIAVFAAAAAAIALGSPSSGATVSQMSEQHPNRSWSGIRSSSRRSLRRTRRIRRVSASERSSTPPSSMPSTGSSDATRHFSSRMWMAMGRAVPAGTSRRAAVVAAAYTTLVGLFPARATELQRERRGFARVAQRRWRRRRAITGARDRLGHGRRPGRTRLSRDRRVQRELPAIHRRGSGRSVAAIPPATTMSAQGLAFTVPFVVESNTQFRPAPPRSLASAIYKEDFDAVKALGRRTGSTRTEAQTRSRLSGRATPASTGIRQPTRSRAPTISRRPEPIVSSPY